MAKTDGNGPRTLVLGTDFSPASENATLRTIKIAKDHDAVVHVVHATTRLPRLFSERLRKENEQKQRKALDDLLDRIRKVGVEARGHVSNGDAIKVLTARARAVAADLVVVGARGRTLPDSMIGSAAERLIAMNRHRVLLVRTPAKHAYSDVLIAANQDSRLKEQIAAAMLFSSSPITVLHAYEAPFESVLLMHGVGGHELIKHRSVARREAKKRMLELIEKAGLKPPRLVLEHGTAAQVLQRVDREALLVLSRGHSVVRQFLLGSVTRAVIAYGVSDVLLT
jgi:nucleotide-binding universal stress UspA family protein